MGRRKRIPKRTAKNRDEEEMSGKGRKERKLMKTNQEEETHDLC